VSASRLLVSRTWTLTSRCVTRESDARARGTLRPSRFLMVETIAMAPSTLLLLTLLFLAVVVSLIYRQDMHAARQRLLGRSSLLPSPYGDIEYAVAGHGTVEVLVVHGAAGGWDQGELIAAAVLDERFRWIAPSRFGYLRSGCPPGASADDQAHAFAFLLDHLHVDRVAVVAMSAGGASALLFALLYPQRVSSLTLLSCGVTASSTEEQEAADRQGKALARICRTDLGFWLTTRLFRKSLLRLMGIDAADVLTHGFDELPWIDRVLAEMHPASLRSRGVALDHEARLPGRRIAAIEAPTLIVHAKDDALQLYHNALFAAANIPHARLLSFDTGGHLIVAAKRSSIRAAVEQHIVSHCTEVHGATEHPSAA
jgi:2-hydroxy-6-oxonona-2,4-dienedioate hydrolase